MSEPTLENQAAVNDLFSEIERIFGKDRGKYNQTLAVLLVSADRLFADHSLKSAVESAKTPPAWYKMAQEAKLPISWIKPGFWTNRRLAQVVQESDQALVVLKSGFFADRLAKSLDNAKVSKIHSVGLFEVVKPSRGLRSLVEQAGKSN